MKLRIKVYSRELGMGISNAQSVVVETGLKSAELEKVLSPLTPYSVQVHRDLSNLKTMSLEEALLWVKNIKFTRVVLVPTTNLKLECVGVLPSLITSVEVGPFQFYTFFFSKYLTLEGAQKVLGELGIQNVHLVEIEKDYIPKKYVQCGAFYAIGEYVQYGDKLYKKEYITTIRKENTLCKK